MMLPEMKNCIVCMMRLTW